MDNGILVMMRTETGGGGNVQGRCYSHFIVDVVSQLNPCFIRLVFSQPSTDWPMFRFGPDHLGATQGITPPLELEWRYATGGKVSSSPAVSGGFVYVGSYDGKIYALDATQPLILTKTRP